MALRRSRGPYAPQRQAQVIDWAAMQAASNRMRAEQQRVDDEARENARRWREEQNPIAQLVRRCAGIDERQNGFEARLDGLDEQLQTIIDLLKGQDS